MKEVIQKYFIPCEDNNYHPHILHTKRAIFYGVMFLVFKVIVVGTALLLPSEVFVMPDILAQEQTEIMHLTNVVRAQNGIQMLRSNEKLEKSAFAKTEDMGEKEYFDHTGPDGVSLADYLFDVGYDYKFAGENLGMGFGDARELVDAWLESPVHYSNLVDRDFVDLGVGLSEGFYKGKPTVYVAQHFGSVRGEKLVSQFNEDTVRDGMVFAASMPEVYYYEDRSSIDWQEVDKNKTQVVATAYIDGPVDEAYVHFLGHSLALEYDKVLDAYVGILMVDAPASDLFKVVYTPGIRIKTGGELVDSSIRWEKMEVVGPTPLQKYVKGKKLLGSVTNLFLFSKGIYVFFILFFSLVLSICILVELKKQHHHVIGQTLLLLTLLVGLWIV